ncbi:hypothetical protein E2C01_072606 [Portunus trituberculatus]|uniref:Transmembrane protein n=1 Tax=Portunus trituberculatus TaxID=210409 RepID=A0A5B7I8A9_PORTR|nr:hypothetical protein [Portunus trituberculatus]
MSPLHFTHLIIFLTSSLILFTSPLTSALTSPLSSPLHQHTQGKEKESREVFSLEYHTWSPLQGGVGVGKTLGLAHDKPICKVWSSFVCKIIKIVVFLKYVKGWLYFD